MNERCLAILCGTLEIERPLLMHLTANLMDHVVLLSAVDDVSLRAQLQMLSKFKKVVILPTNEVTLNRAFAAIGKEGDGRFIIPGTAHQDRLYHAAELCDKSVTKKLLAGANFKGISLLRSWILPGEPIDDIFAPHFPAILKPCRKDDLDSFTHSYPAKLVMVENRDELDAILTKWAQTRPTDRFLLQEFGSGHSVSWGGSIFADKIIGYRIDAVIKSPQHICGGTTTLAKISHAGPILTAAIGELAAYLKLDGIFEVEFIETSKQTYSLIEINPRPWLQSSLLLGRSPDIFLSYLEHLGFTTRQGSARKHHAPSRWGSAWRYEELNRNAGCPISFSIFLRTLFHDVRFSRFFRIGEKAAYVRSMVRSLFKIMKGK